MSRPLTAAEFRLVAGKLMGLHECLRLTAKDKDNDDTQELRACDQSDGSVIVHAHDTIPVTEGMGS